MDADARQAMEIVRKADPDRYIATLYAPEDRRGALFALHAFDAEIARVRDLVSEPLPGEIRLQWWRDALSAGTAEPAGHPVATALRKAIEAHDLPRATFDAYLDARIFDLYDDPMPDRATLEGYCGETSSALIQLGGLILDRGAAPAHATAAGHAGCARAIARMVALMPLHRARGQCFVPAEILAAAGLTRDDYLAGADRRAMGTVTSAMIALATEHLAAFHRAAGALPPSLRPAFLPLAALPSTLARLSPNAWEKPASEPSQLRRHVLILRRALRGWPRL